MTERATLPSNRPQALLTQWMNKWMTFSSPSATSFMTAILHFSNSQVPTGLLMTLRMKINSSVHTAVLTLLFLLRMNLKIFSTRCA